MARRSARARGGGGGAGGFAYWLVHGSFDWFWEFAGLGAPAFALLGLACALAPRREPSATGSRATCRTRRSAAAFEPCDATVAAGSPGPALPARRARRRRDRLGGVVRGALAEPAARCRARRASGRRAPQTAYARLNDAARLNPLSDEPYLVAGSIALRFGELAPRRPRVRAGARAHARRRLRDARAGAIASTEGDRARGARAARAGGAAEPARSADPAGPAAGPGRASG